MTMGFKFSVSFPLDGFGFPCHIHSEVRINTWKGKYGPEKVRRFGF